MSKIRPGQTIFDTAVIETGDVLKAFEIAFKNGLNVSDDLGGSIVAIAADDVDPTNTILKTYNRNKYEPATSNPDVAGIFDITFEKSFE